MPSARSGLRIETRKKIIKNSASLLNHVGYLSVSVAELEKATGESKAVLYGYFVNKDALAMAVLDYSLEQKREQINDFVKLCEDNRDKLNAHVMFYYPAMESSFNWDDCQLFNAAIEAGTHHEEMRQKVARALLEWKQDLVNIIHAGIRDDEFKPGIQADDIAWQLISLIESAVIISKTTQNRDLGIKLLNQAKCLVTNL
jgi:TetR/AcrR family transcriptional repressor of nem operon